MSIYLRHFLTFLWISFLKNIGKANFPTLMMLPHIVSYEKGYFLNFYVITFFAATVVSLG